MKKIKEQQLKSVASTKNGWIKFFISAILGLVAIYSIINYVPYFANRQSLVIITHSMSPLINVGDLAIINKDYDISTLEVNDIIAFNTDINDDGKTEIVVHYIALIENDGLGNYTIRTRREGVTEQIDWDSWQLDENDIVGVYNFKIIGIGKLLLFLSSTFGKFVAAVNLIVIFFVIDYFKKEKEEKEQATKKYNKIKLQIKNIKNNNNVKIKSIKDDNTIVKSMKFKIRN